MNLELKNIKYFPDLSEETLCFIADLFVDGEEVAYCKNTGKGEMTSIMPHTREDREVLNKAEEYARTLPNLYVGNTTSPEGFKCTLDGWVDYQVAIAIH